MTNYVITIVSVIKPKKQHKMVIDRYECFWSRCF